MDDLEIIPVREIEWEMVWKGHFGKIGIRCMSRLLLVDVNHVYHLT
jgi:hypothetical protein